MSLGESIRHGAKWLLAGNLAGQILQFAFGIVLARVLVPADFGLLVTVQIFTGLAGFIATGGTGQALVRAKEAKLEDFQVVFTIQLAIGLLIYALFFITAPLFAHWYKEPLYNELFRVSALSFILRPFVNMPSIWLTREMRFKQRTVVSLACGTLGSIVSVTLAMQDFGVWSLVLGGLSGAALSAAALYGITPVRPAIRFDPALARELGLYGFKFTSNEIATYVRKQTPNFFLGQLQGPAIVGLFNKADSLARAPRVVTHSVYDPIFRGLAASQDNLDRSRYIYFRTVMLLTVYMTPLFVGLAWLAQPFVAFVYGPKWISSAAPLAILSLTGPLASIGNPSGAVLAARNWLGKEIFVHLLQTILFAASCIIGLRWGLSGVAIGILVSEGIGMLFIAFLVARCIKSTFLQFATSLAPGLLLNLILVGVLALADFLLPTGFGKQHSLAYLLIMSTAGGIAYISAFFLLPISALTTEVARWKSRLPLAFGGRRTLGE